MVVAQNEYAIPSDVPFVSQWKHSVLTINSTDVLVGCVRLVWTVGMELRQAIIFQRPCPWQKSRRNGSSLRISPWSANRDTWLNTDFYLATGVAFTQQRHTRRKKLARDITKLDIVPCIRCLYWPLEAAEWATRIRLQGWPSNELIDKIVSEGCHFVAVSHKFSPNRHTVFRFSFTKAENLLFNNMTYSQEICYQVLRIMLKFMNDERSEDGVFLCWYYFKTLILWDCDVQLVKFWNKSRLEISVMELALCMTAWIIESAVQSILFPVTT